jgi:predicted transcriptional regulator of viral defense system
VVAQSNIDPTLAARLAKGVLRARDIEALGIPRVQLSRWVAAGELVRIGRGLYALPDREIGEHESILHAAKRVDRGIICLLSALRIHELGTQNPPEVWLALPRTARAPRLDWPPLRTVRWSGAALTTGVVKRNVDGVRVRMTTPARTVADCFKHRSTVGLDVAIEALRDYRRKGAGTIDELMEAAKVCRVHRVMRPYLEALA